jgi:hypothetical protein
MGLGAGLAETLLGTDLGYRGPRIECWAGHPAGFVGYRGKTITTVLGPVLLRRPGTTARPAGPARPPRRRAGGRR